MTSLSTSLNCGGYIDTGGSRSQDTIHSSSCNLGTIVHGEGRGRYRFPTSHYFPSKQGERDKLLIFTGDNVGGDGRVGYRSHTSHCSSLRGYIRGES